MFLAQLEICLCFPYNLITESLRRSYFATNISFYFAYYSLHPIAFVSLMFWQTDVIFQVNWTTPPLQDFEIQLMLPFTVFIGHLISTKECILIFLHKLSNIECPAYLDVKTNIRKERVTFRGQMPFDKPWKLSNDAKFRFTVCAS